MEINKMNTYFITVLEDDIVECNKIIKYIDSLSSFEIVNISNNSSDAIDAISKYQPHAIILDLELHRGNGSGFDVLKSIPSLNIKRYPYIVVTTNNISNVTYEIARKLGADYIFYKHETDYSIEKIMELLKLAVTIQKDCPVIELDIAENEIPIEEKENILKREIIKELNILGMSPKYLGYEYLTEAILCTMNNCSNNYYNYLSKKYKKSKSSIERAMQGAISRTWNSVDINDLLINYTARIDSKKGCPTIMEFVYYFANKIKKS